MKLKYFFPLIMFMIPTVIFSILMWPPEALQPIPVGGFVMMLVSVVLTYISGLQSILKDARQADLREPK